MTPTQAILCLVPLTRWLAAGVETDCESRHPDANLISEPIHEALGKSYNLFETLFPYEKNGNNTTSSVDLRHIVKSERENKFEKHFEN